MKKTDDRRGNTDRIFKKMADLYVETEGARLQLETAQRPAIPAAPLRLDSQIQRGIRRVKNQRIAMAAVSAAACLLTVCLLPGLLRQSSFSTAPSSADSVIAFTYTLPANLSMENCKQDQGQTIYYLKDQQEDDVIMTLEKGALPDVSALTRYSVDGYAAYGRETADYQLLLFQKEGILYTLTCRYRMDTLLKLAKNIL